MAMWGINLVLAYTGQEHVFRNVFNDIGVNDTILNETFNGPAFLTWSRGQGSFGVGGPLPNYWIESQKNLQLKIVTRLRSLGMYPILPGFQGNVPKQMPELFPKANTSGGWLDAADPLFSKIAHQIGAGMKAEFGTSSFVEADGWFSLETGPWMGTFDENPAIGSTSLLDFPTTPTLPFPATSATEVAGAFNVASAVNVAGGAGGAGVTGDADYGDCLGGFKIPSEEEAFTRARAVFASLTDAEPNATWIYQGYPWFRVYSQGGACNQTALRQFVRGFTRAIPEDRLLLLDLIADRPGGESALWSYPDDPKLGKFVQNASLIWCALNNWGGAVNMGGDLSYVLNQTREAMATPAVKGVGLTPEGIDNSPAYFSLVLDSPWTPQPTAASWYNEWGASRCGTKGVVAAEKAYELLFQTVYRPDQPYLWCCSNPVWCPTTLPGQSPSRPTYNTTKLRQALELMVEAAPSCNTAAFHYDLVDVAREWMSMVPCIDAFDKVEFKTAAPDDLIKQTAALKSVMNDIDTMMMTDGGFLLGSWLKDSRAVSDWDGSNGTLADFYEYNSRMQITTWAGAYSRREWSGHIKQYYGGRLDIWLDCQLDQQAQEKEATELFAANAIGYKRTAATAATAATRSIPSGKYSEVVDYDCNYQDIEKVTCPSSGLELHGGGGDPEACIAFAEAACDRKPGCIGFNYPGLILKAGCTGWETSPRNHFYFKPGSTAPKSSCIDGYCSVNTQGNGTYPGMDCNGQCPQKPKPKPKSCAGHQFTKRLSDFSTKWNNEVWTEDDVDLPSEPVGDPVATAIAMLAKYPGL